MEQMKPVTVGKGIINYIFAMVFAAVFALFLNANVGWYVLFTLILAPLVSVLLAWLAARFLRVRVEARESILSKGDRCRITVKVYNRFLFPTPPVAIHMVNAPGVRCEDEKVLVSLWPMGRADFQVPYRAQICGLSPVGIGDVRVTDYLGLFSFRVKVPDAGLLQKNMAVLPNVAEVSNKEQLVLKAMQMCNQNDESEETIEAAWNAVGGFPGYDNRDYVPGDPVKRINWKQSMKRGKLLVRLDEEMAAQSVAVVLDSVFKPQEGMAQMLERLPQYRECRADEVLPKVAEDAVENALGMVELLLRYDFKVHFYVYDEKEFRCYSPQDEGELEEICMDLASYAFAGGEDMPRLPVTDEHWDSCGAVLYVTPNRGMDAHRALDGKVDWSTSAIYAVPDEAMRNSRNGEQPAGKVLQVRKETESSRAYQIKSLLVKLAVPFVLSMLLSTMIFSVFEVPFWSFWTVLQLMLCTVCFVMGEYTRRNKIAGGMMVTVFVFVMLSAASRMAFGGRNLLNYMHWFLSGGESVETQMTYLCSVLFVFTPFFALVVYYFIRILYRTSFLMLVSLIPAVLHVKVMQDIPMVPVVLIMVCNITAFLLHVRTGRDGKKRIEREGTGWFSLGFYLLLLMLTGFAAPNQEDAKYYYIFESLFMGGNVSEKLPEGYSELSDFSGNADGMAVLNNRKLYEIEVSGEGSTMGDILYLKRQNFDLYDFELDRWYGMEDYGATDPDLQEWYAKEEILSIAKFSEALQRTEKYVPGFLERYGMEYAAVSYPEMVSVLRIQATNYESKAYIVPDNVVGMSFSRDMNLDSMRTAVTPHGTFRLKSGLMHGSFGYSITCMDENIHIAKMIALGGADMESAVSMAMLEEMETVFEEHEERELLAIVHARKEQLREAMIYDALCCENTEAIPASVKELAREITKDCIYDWEKADALQQFFRENDFVYDMDYRAPDDSVEYFLFESKRGTCSDYASAYALMGRAVGLVVRYAEGFVPQREYQNTYVVRTDSGHAYPEVFIPNVGFVRYEATNPARFAEREGDGGFLSYFMQAGFRFLIVLAIFAAGIIFILFMVWILLPGCREAYFRYRFVKAEDKQAVVMVYCRIRDKHARATAAYTPYEFGTAFRKENGCDVMKVCEMLERQVYDNSRGEKVDREQLLAVYRAAVKAVRRQKRAKNDR